MQVPVDQLTKRPLEAIEYVFIHHSVAAQTLDVEDINRMEIAAQGFICTGYNAYIRKNPSTGKWEIQEARPMNCVPAAQYGMNTEGYAICIAGNYEPNVSGVPTNQVEQEALDLAIERIKAVKAHCPHLKTVLGHRDVAAIKSKQGLNPGDYSTECPGDLLYARLHDVRLATKLPMPSGLI